MMMKAAVLTAEGKSTVRRAVLRAQATNDCLCSLSECIHLFATLARGTEHPASPNAAVAAGSGGPRASASSRVASSSAYAPNCAIIRATTSGSSS